MKIKIALPWQILIALVLGVIFGIFGHEYVKYVSWAGDMFLRLLKMIVIPIVFSLMMLRLADTSTSIETLYPRSSIRETFTHIILRASSSR